METTLRALSEDDLAPLLALQHRLAGRSPSWSAAELREEVFDHARGEGRNVVVAEVGGHVRGVAGWVHAPPWLYGAPVVVAGAEAAERLVAHLVDRGRALGVAHLRVSVGDAEHDKRAALLVRGFRPVFAFITFTRRIGRAPAFPETWQPFAVEGLTRIAHADLDPHALAPLHNATFRDVPNAPPVDAEEMRRALAADSTDRELTSAYVDGQGRYRAFLLAVRDVEDGVPFVAVDAIGVDERLRGRRVGQAILEDALWRNALREAPAEELRALIASINLASIALHRRVGLAERCRRTVHQLELVASGGGSHSFA